MNFNEIILEGVDLIASGYDWLCLECDDDEFNHEIEVPTSMQVTCPKCGTVYSVRDINEAYE